MGTRWLSDYEIDKVFNIVNDGYDNTIDFVCTSIIHRGIVSYKLQNLFYCLMLLDMDSANGRSPIST